MLNRYFRGEAEFEDARAKGLVKNIEN